MANLDSPRVYKLSHNVALKNCITDIRSLAIDGEHEVIVRPIKQGKTLAQLGGLFGLWAEYVANEIGESVDYIHRMWKSMFLARIYVADHLDSESRAYAQEIDSWCELLQHYQQIQDMKKLTRHAKRISLSWSNLDQMTRYMNAIEAHYQSEGLPLPILDKFRKYYK